MRYLDVGLQDVALDVHELLILTLPHGKRADVLATIVEDLLDLLRALLRHVACLSSRLRASGGLRGVILHRTTHDLEERREVTSHVLQHMRLGNLRRLGRDGDVVHGLGHRPRTQIPHMVGSR